MDTFALRMVWATLTAATILVAQAPPATQPANPAPTNPAPTNPAPTAGPAGQPAAPTIVFGENSTIRVPAQPTAEATILLDASNIPKDALSKVVTPKMTDLEVGSSTQTKVTFANPAKVFSGDTQGIWQFKVTVAGLPPNSSQARKLVVTLDKDYAKDYVVTNIPAAAVNWSVPAVATPWIVRWDGKPEDRVLGFVVTTLDQPATNFRIATASLRDASNVEQIGPERLELSETPDGQDGKFALKGRDTHTFYLRLKDLDPKRHGKYTGAVSFAIDERPELQTVQVSLNASSSGAKAFGVLLLAAGLFLAWWMGVRGRPAIARLQALKAVINVRDALERFGRDLSAIPAIPDVSYTGVNKRLKGLQDKISTARLDGASLLPGRFLIALGTASDSTSKLQDLLTQVGAELLAMTAVLQNGISKVAAEWRGAPADKQVKAVTALKKLDDLGASAKDVTEAQSGVATILAEFHQPPANAPADMAPRSMMRQLDPVTIQQVEHRIELFSNAGWWIWGIISVTVGCAILIIPNSGFGSAMDYILCLLWGLGIPTASAKLQELTPTSVGSSIGTSVPK